MTPLRKLPQCFSCRYHDRTGYLVRAVHPSGPISDRCADFDEITEVAANGTCPPGDHAFGPWNPPVVHWDCPSCGWMDDSV